MQVSAVFVIALCFGEHHIKGMLDVASIFVGNNFPSVRTHLLVVDNQLETPHESNRFGGVYINGNNSQLEFSGWQRGINYLTDHFNPLNTDVVVFLNDTVHRRDYAVGGKRYFEAYLIDYEGPLPQFWSAGYCDDFPTETSINGLKFSSWIRSNLFAMNWPAVQIVNPLVFPCSFQEVFDLTPSDRFWAKNPPMSANWIAYISSWLFGTEDPRYPEYRLKWIRSEKLNACNRSYFQRKAMSILSEHYLSARLLNSNVHIFDFNTYPKMPDRHTSPYYT